MWSELSFQKTAWVGETKASLTIVEATTVHWDDYTSHANLDLPD